MREIKFRAWDKVNKRIYDVVSIEWTFGDILRQYYPNAPEGNERWLAEQIVVILANGKKRIYNYQPKPASKLYRRRNLKDLVLLEYTGLKDKNGVRIYEGDIVKALTHTYEDGNGGEREVIGKVIYNTEQFLGYQIGTMRMSACFRFEVIGNIYESKDLLK